MKAARTLNKLRIFYSLAMTLAFVTPVSAQKEQQVMQSRQKQSQKNKSQNKQSQKKIFLTATNCNTLEASQSPKPSPAISTDTETINKFDSIRWKHDPGHLATKKDMIADLLANYKLIGMSRKDLYALLGHPEPGSSFHSYASYFIYYPMSHHPSELQFAFSNDKVTKYRQTGGTAFFYQKKAGYSEIDEWVDSPVEKALDDKAIAEAKSKVLKRPISINSGLEPFSTVALPLPEDELLLNEVKEHMKAPVGFPAALKASSRFLQLYPNDFNMLITQGHLHSELHQYEKAIQDYSGVINLSVDQAATGGHEKRARLYMKLRKYDAAIADYSAALNYLLSQNSLRKDPFSIAADFRAGRVYAGRGLAELKLGQTDKALDDLNNAISLLSINRKEPYLWRAKVYDALKQPALAKADIDFAQTLQEGGRAWSFDIDE